MATNRNLRFKTSRRFGVNIYGHPKALKRQVADARQKKQSEYGVQLSEKQKVKAMYNLLEKQFYRYYDKARRMSGVVGETCCSCWKPDWTTLYTVQALHVPSVRLVRWLPTDSSWLTARE